MNTWIEINEIRFSRLDNALHTQLHRLLYRLIVARVAGMEVLHLPHDLMAEWQAQIVKEEDIARVAMASLDTGQMDELNRQRVHLLRHIRNHVRTQAKSPNTLARKPAERLKLVTDMYANAHRQSLERQTLLVESLLIDLHKEPTRADVEALQLWPYAEELQSVNAAYKALRAHRSAVWAESKQPAARTVRPRTDELFRLACRYLQATHLLTSSAELRAGIEALVGQMHQQADEVMLAYLQSLGQKRAAQRRAEKRRNAANEE